MARLHRWLVPLLLTGLTGCAAARSQIRAAGMTMAPGATMAPGMTMAPAGQPTSATKMICSAETAGNVAKLAGLPTAVPGAATWSDDLYTCTYEVSSARLVLSVKQSADAASARAYFDQLRERLQPVDDLQGVAGLGLPSFETATGTVVFLKDASVLAVDATRLAPTLGSTGETRGELAYSLAADVLACWNGK